MVEKLAPALESEEADWLKEACSF
ncbi:MAG: hypothetical protein MUC60_14215 [Oscillatoria sp. Prado101]|nr:hypothetical protein [Oscillatoria sp. Prado101]